MSFAQPFENFEILERVGAGAMGTVFRARQKHLGRIVALKVLKPSLARDERYVARMRREAQIVGRLNHPNIVTAYDVGEEGGYHFFVMEFVAGRSLKQLLAEWGRFPEERVLDVAIQLAEALRHAHELGVIHRDVKPGNVLVDEQGRIKLTDMGLAKAKTDLTLTRDGATVGTPQYISPEQARDAQDVDARTDLYSLGATMFHMATGQPPFRGETIGELIHQVLHVPAPHANAVYPQLGDGLSLVIRKLLAKDRALRYQTAAELLEDLHRVQRRERPTADREVLDAEEVGGRSSAGPFVRRRGRVWRAAAVAGLIGVAAGVAVGRILPRAAARDAAAGATARDFERRVDAALAAEPRLRERVEVLAALRTAVTSPAFGERLVAERRALFAQLDRAVDERIAAWTGPRRAETLDWLRGADDWRAGGEFVRAVVEPDLAAAIGYRSDELPDPELRARAAARIAALDAALEPLRAMRDAELRVAHRRHLDEVVRPAVAAALAADDFRTARDRLDALPGTLFDGSDWPTAERLPGALRAELTAVADELRAEFAPRIDAREAQVAGALGDEAARRAEALDRLAADLDARRAPPWPLEAALERTRRTLRSVYPPAGAFGPGVVRPWDGVERRLRTVEAEARALRDRHDLAVFDGLAASAFAAFDRGGPSAALAVLEAVDGLIEPVETRRRRLGRAFAAAAGWVAALAADGGRALPAIDGGELALRPGVDGAAPQLDGGGWRAVDWPRVAADGVAREHALAAALLATGTDPGWLGVAGLAADDRELLARDAVPRWRASVSGTDVEVRAEAALTALLDAHRRGDRTAVASLLASFEERFAGSESARRGAALLAEIRGAIDTTGVAEAGAPRRLPPGWTVLQTADGAVGARTEIGRQLEHAGPGWRVAEPGTLQFDAPRPELPTLAEAGVRMPSPLPASAAVRAELELRLPPAGAEPRALIFAVHGVAVFVCVLPAGNAIALAFDLRDCFARPLEVQRRFASALVADDQPARAVVVPGGWHRLRVELEPRRGGVAIVQAWLDDLRFPPARVEGLDPAAPARIDILPLQRAAFRGLEVVGRGG